MSHTSPLKRIGLIVCLFILSAATAGAYSSYVDRIPNGAVFSCDNCHYPDNAFNSAFNSAGKVWTAALAAADSDGDGYTNGQELQDPSGSWSQGDPAPGNPADVSNPGDSASFPSNDTPTPQPTDTPEPSPTNTPAPSGTPTPDICSATGVTLEMPADYFRPGDTFFCRAIVCNTGTADLTMNPLFVILDIMGSYYFAPAFNDFGYYDMTFPPGATSVDVLSAFTWPDGAGSFTGAIFYGAMTDPGITSLFGEMDSVKFGWGN